MPPIGTDPLRLLTYMVAILLFIAPNISVADEGPGSVLDSTSAEVQNDHSADELMSESVVDIIDLAFMLATEKVITGARFSSVDGLFTARTLIDFVYKTSDEREDGFEGSFLGNRFALDLGVIYQVVPRVSLSLGSGIDCWYLWGINADEVKLSLPLWLEGRFHITPKWSAVINTRMNVISSDGLSYGATREEVRSGESGGAPLMTTVGIGFHL